MINKQWIVNETEEIYCGKILRNFPNISLGAKGIIQIVPVRTADQEVDTKQISPEYKSGALLLHQLVS